MERQRPSDNPGQWIGQLVQIQIDRPLASRHPRFEATIYPVNYGFVPGTRAADGQEIDAYVLGVGHPLDRFEGRCIAIVRRADDSEDKLVIAPDGLDFADSEILETISFQEKYFRSVLVR